MEDTPYPLIISFMLLGLDLVFLVEHNNRILYPVERIDRINKEFDKIIEVCHKNAVKTIQANAEMIKNLIPELVDKKNIFKTECEKILQDLGGIKKPEE